MFYVIYQGKTLGAYDNLEDAHNHVSACIRNYGYRPTIKES